MWTLIVSVPSSRSATVMAVQLTYSTDLNGECELHFKLKDFLTFGLITGLSACVVKHWIVS